MRESTAKKTLYDVARQWDKMADQVERIEVEMPTPDHEAPRRH